LRESAQVNSKPLGKVSSKMSLKVLIFIVAMAALALIGTVGLIWMALH
jgi:hypothetical protein